MVEYRRIDSPMRIALVTEVFLPAVDGVVTRLRHTLEQLQEAGDEILVVAPAGGPPEYAGAVIVGMPGLRMPLYPDGVGYPRSVSRCRAPGSVTHSGGFARNSCMRSTRSCSAPAPCIKRAASACRSSLVPRTPPDVRPLLRSRAARAARVALHPSASQSGESQPLHVGGDAEGALGKAGGASGAVALRRRSRPVRTTPDQQSVA